MMPFTYSVATTGNIKALLLNLFSVLNAAELPAGILVRFEGEFPSFADFYLEQAAELARIKGVNFSLSTCRSTNIRDTRDWMLDNCPTPYLWMGDDDVLFTPRFLAEANFYFDKLEDKNWGWVVGSKVDLNNRRGYKDFNVKENPAPNKDGANYNWMYPEGFCNAQQIPEVYSCDTGACFIHVAEANLHGIRFRLFEDQTNCGGEDTALALSMRKKGLKGYFFPGIRAWHLSGPNGSSNFSNEFEARGEALLRTCDLLGFDKKLLKKNFMPWLWKNEDNTDKDNQVNK